MKHIIEIKPPNIETEFSFSGLNLQHFCGSTLIDDYFNTDGKYEKVSKKSVKKVSF